GGDLRRVHQQGSATDLLYAPDLVSTIDQFRGTAYVGGAYTQDAIDLPKGHLTVGARVDGHSHVSSAIAVSYASVSFDPLARTHLEFDWGRYGQFPELNQLFSTFAEGRLRPEKAAHYEGIVEQRLNDRTRVRFEVY